MDIALVAQSVLIMRPNGSVKMILNLRGIRFI